MKGEWSQMGRTLTNSCLVGDNLVVELFFVLLLISVPSDPCVWFFVVFGIINKIVSLIHRFIYCCCSLPAQVTEFNNNRRPTGLVSSQLPPCPPSLATVRCQGPFCFWFPTPLLKRPVQHLYCSWPTSQGTECWASLHTLLPLCNRLLFSLSVLFKFK